jgi:YbbR domain-containing protein
VNWVTESWRLKLLAIGLSVLMLGAVAFSQNPPRSKTLSVPIAYQGTVPDGIVLINPPSKTNVTVTGLADTIASVTANSVTAEFDLSKVTPGPRVRVNLIVKSIPGVQIDNPTVPVFLDIELRVSVKLTVTVRTPRVSTGWQVTHTEARCPASPCIVNFTGPQSWETDLHAYADFPNPIENSSYDVLSQPVILVNNGATLDLTTVTFPASTLDNPNVEIAVQAKTGTTSRQVVLIDSAPSHGPPAGYRVTNVVITPITVVISGAPEILVKITTISLPAVDLSGHTSDVTFKVQVPYPIGVDGSAAIAKVTYTISPNPSVTAPP